MPISDEVIELAPVKKTKKTLIIMIAGMGVLFALAIAFLVMYLVKPSVTEDNNHVKDVSVNYTELFSVLDENGQQALYASIGNEYTVYSTITVDDDSSTNVSWIWDPALIEVKEQKSEDGAYLKFIPRVGMHGKTATITACAASHKDSSQKIEFTIINQGTEDIQITQYGVSGNLQKVEGDTLDKVVEMTVPYYTMAQTENNKSFRVMFNQIGKYNATSDEYAKRTCVDIGDSKNTGDVAVTLKNAADSQYIEIDEGRVSANDFYFTAKKFTPSDHTVEILIQANVNNADDCDVITKTIKVKVESNTASKYVDTMLVFNKPVVDAAFMGSIITGGNATLIDTQKVNTEIGKDKTLKVLSGNRKFFAGSSDFELVLPYSRSVTYNEIFRHVAVNPVNIQYAGGKIIENWYQYISVDVVSDTKAVTVTTKNDEVMIAPTGLSGLSGGAAKCKLILTDKRPGSAGAKVEVPVRVIAQTKNVELKVVDGNITYTKDDEEHSLSNIDAGTGSTYAVSVSYTFVAPDEKPETLLENNTLNNAYMLKFDTDELEVRLKGSDKTLLPDNRYVVTEFGSFAKTGGSGAQTQFTAVLNFDVKVKKDDDGAAVLRFLKDGSYLYDTGAENSLSKLDVAADIAASFKIVECAKKAEFVKTEDGLKVVTNNGEVAGNYVRESDNKAKVYVQKQAEGTKLELITPEKVKELITADKSFFTVSKSKTSFVSQGSISGGFINWRDTDENRALTFSGNPTQSSTRQFTLKFDVLNINSGVIGTFELDVYIIDAITKITVPTENKSASYGGDGNASVKIEYSDVKMICKLNTNPAEFRDYTDVNLYYNSDIMFGADAEKATSKVKNGDNTISFKHKTTELYVFDARNRTLSIKTDIYAYSHEVGINFGNVELEFLLRDTDEYLGKHNGVQFSSNDLERMKVEFVRNADGVALFSHADCEQNAVIPYDRENEIFTLRANQDENAEIYACAIVKVGDDDIYVNRKSEKNGKMAPVEKAYFSLPTGITAVTQDGPQPGLYYYITCKTPKIEDASKTYPGGKVYYSGNSNNKLTVVVNNETRTIKTIGFFSDAACNNSISELTFGGFINKADKYSNTVYIKVEYDTLLSSHTAFEQLELALPSYLELLDGVLNSKADAYILVPSDDVKNINEKVFACEIRLIRDEEITDSATITAMPSNHKTDGKNATCTASVNAGLKELAVKNGNITVATVKAGNTETYNYSFNLSNKSDIKSLTLGFTYGAINGEGYDLAYDHTGAGLKVVCLAAVNGLTTENNIKAATSEYTIKIDAANVITLDSQKITLTFTDEYNGANANNVFTLELYITVTLDIYDLAFADDTQTTVTVTGSSSDAAKTLPITVKYNGGIDTAQPTATVIAENTVLYVYTKNGEQYNKYEVGDIHVAKDGASYTLVVPNDINRKNKFYLGLEYNGKLFTTREIIINTQTAHIEFADDNIKLTKVDGQDYYTANVVVKKADELFNVIANVVNDGSGQVENGKTANYGLYTDWDFETTASGVSIAGGKFAVTTPSKITDTVYYRAWYYEQKLDHTYELKVAITYTLAPNAVMLSGITADGLYDDTNKIITLYYNTNGYTSIDLTNYVSVTNAFGVNYGTANVTKAIATESSLVQINGLTIKPTGVTDNDVTNVTVVLSATFEGVKVENEYTVKIVPVAGLSFDDDEGTISLLDRTATAIATPEINNTYSGLTPVYTFSADANADGKFTVSGEDDTKTIALATNTTAQNGKAYTFTGSLTYSFGGTPFAVSGTFGSTATYTVNVVGDYALTFNLTANGSTITPYDKTDATKHSVVDKANTTYVITVTSDDSKFDVAYSAVATNVVTIAAFSSKSAAVTLVENASGAFDITVSATVGGATYTCKQSYYFMYGDNVSTKMYVSQNSGAYSEFTADTKAIDFETAEYKFKYEISGLPSEAEVNVVVNGEVTVSDHTDGTAATRYVEITAAKPTTLRIGGSVKIGTRTIYLGDKTVTLTATAPNFTLKATKYQSSTEIDSVMPSEKARFTVGNSATDFLGNYSTTYAVNSTAYATIDATSGVLTAKTNVLTDQPVVVTATVNVNSGAYKGATYTVSKTITVKGVSLPTIKWNDGANADIAVGSKDYSSLYTFNNVTANYTYNDTTVSITASSTSLASTDYSISNGVLTIKNTVTAGGTVTLTVTASINSGAHAGEETVPAEITVRVLPTMNTTTNNIALGNAKYTYDLNGTAYKSVFAPNGVNTSDYSIVSLSVTDDDIEVNGSNLIVKNNITTAKSAVNVTATVLITEGTFKGVKITGTKTVSFTLPTKPTDKNFTWSSDNNKYGTVTLSQLSDIMGNVSGTVQSVTATVDGDAADYVAVTVGSGANVTLDVDKAYGAYLTGDGGNKTFDVNYVVTVDGKVYYGKATYNVPKQKITVKAVLGGDELTETAFEVKSTEVVLIDLSADKGFTVYVKNVTVANVVTTDSNTYLTVVNVGDAVKLTASSVTTDQTVKLTLELSVAGISSSLEYTVKVIAPTTGAAYTTDDREIYVKKDSSEEVTSTWSYNSSDYKYGESVKIQVSSGRLSDYFTQIKVAGKTATISGTNITVNFDKTGFPIANKRPSLTGGFDIDFIFKTASKVNFTFTVTLTVYNVENNGRNPITVPYTYSVHVIDDLTVTFDKNGDNVTDCAESKVVYYKTNYGELPVPKRVGYTFGGWYDARTGGESIDTNTTVTATQNHTLYAHWTICTYSLAYDVAVEDKYKKTVEYNKQYGELPTPTRVGYDFVGWKDGEDNTVIASSLVQPTDYLTDTKTLTLYAQWSKKLFTIKLDENYTGGMAWTFKVPYNESFELHQSFIPAREGYAFDGWYLGAEDGADEADAISKVTEDVTLYAHWTRYITIILDANGGNAGNSGTGYRTTVVSGGTYSTHLSVVPTRDGYKFDGWYTGETDGEKKDSAIPNVTAPFTLYAHWTKLYTVTLDLDGGTIAGKSTYTATVESGSSYSEHLNLVPTKSGFKFVGWDKSAIASVTENTTITAQWAKLYTVSFNLNYTGATQTITAREYVNDDKYGLLETPVRDGYKFDGWYTATTDGSQVTKDTTVNLSEDQTLYAYWTKLYTVTFDLDGGTIAGKSTYTATVESGSSYSEHLNLVPTKSGFKFVGWDKTAIASVTENTTITAQWAKLYTVSFNLNYTGATQTITAREYVNNDKYGLLETPVRDGYKFDGWYTATTGGSEVTKDTTVNLSEDQTLYAHWKRIYTVTLNFNDKGESVDNEDTTYVTEVVEGEKYSMHLTFAPVREGYIFKGWYDYNELSQYTSELTVTEDVIMYAKWEAENSNPIELL